MKNCEKVIRRFGFRWVIRESNSIPVIPKKIDTRSTDTKYYRDVYRNRHLVENLFARLKQFRGIAIRFDKMKRNYKGKQAMACAYLWLKLWCIAIKGQHAPCN